MQAASRLLEAIAKRDFAAVRDALDPEVRFRFATPNKAEEVRGAQATADQLAVWFGQGEVVPLEQGSAAGPVGKARIWYRFRVRPQPVTKAPGWHVIEQQCYLDGGDAAVRNLRMVCSGFVPEEDKVGVAKVDAQVQAQRSATTMELDPVPAR